MALTVQHLADPQVQVVQVVHIHIHSNEYLKELFAVVGLVAIGKYACHYSPAAAARYFSRKIGKRVSKNTVKSIKKAYMAESRKRPRDESVDHLPF